jgi:hypothetical protein
MIQTLALIKLQYGGAEEYVQKICGLTLEDINIIRKRLLINESVSEDAVGWRWSHVSRL